MIVADSDCLALMAARSLGLMGSMSILLFASHQALDVYVQE